MVATSRETALVEQPLGPPIEKSLLVIRVDTESLRANLKLFMLAILAAVCGLLARIYL